MHYLKRFSVTGSVCPSTSIFGERAAVEVSKMAAEHDRVVVAGVGSGVVASRILRHLPDAVFVECDPRFAARFAERHPDARIVVDKVQNLYVHEPALRHQRLLLASFIPTAGSFYSDDLARMFVSICRSGGSVIQMRYLPHQMSARFFDGLRERGIVSRRCFTVARNLPPVSMYALRSLLAPVHSSLVPKPVLGTAAQLHPAIGHAAGPRQAARAAR